MKNDLYTKIILTIIALLLAVIALEPAIQMKPATHNFASVQPVPSLSPAQSESVVKDFSGVQLIGDKANPVFFDTRTGDVWEYAAYFSSSTPTRHFRLTQLGADISELSNKAER